MDVTVIIVNFNTSRMVLDCVTSVSALTEGITFEIIVVDNGSQIEDLEQLRGDGRFILIESGENIGFGGANNLGAEKAAGEFLFLLNPDTILINNAIDVLFKYMRNNRRCGISGGNLFLSDLSSAHSFNRWFPSILSEMDFAFGRILRKLVFGRNMEFNHSGKPLSVAMITGADLMIRHSVWEKVGGFDERFFMYCEDADLCLRAKQIGYMVTSVPEAEIIHLEGGSFNETETRWHRIFEGRFVFFRKHYGRMYNFFADCLNITTFAAAVAVYCLLRNKRRKHDFMVRLRTYFKLMRTR